MPNSLRSKLSKLRYKGEITQEEYSELIKKLDGHDKELLDKVLEKIKDYFYEIEIESPPYTNTVVDFRDIDSVIAEMKAEIEE